MKRGVGRGEKAHEEEKTRKRKPRTKNKKRGGDTLSHLVRKIAEGDKEKVEKAFHDMEYLDVGGGGVQDAIAPGKRKSTNSRRLGTKKRSERRKVANGRKKTVRMRNTGEGEKSCRWRDVVRF